MTCVNFKPHKYSIEKLVDFLEGVERSETNNSPEKEKNAYKEKSKNINPNKRICDENEKSHDTSNANKKIWHPCKLCKMFGASADMYTTDKCDKKNLLSTLLDKHKKKHSKEACREDFFVREKAFKTALHKKKMCKRSCNNLDLNSSSDDEEWFNFILCSFGVPLTKLEKDFSQIKKQSRLVKLSPELVATGISKKLENDRLEERTDK
eukprot:12648288-Ditylum_brightwellii.AAC.1